MVSWVFMACSAVYYIGSNSSLVPFFGTFAGLAMMLICGVFDMSAALFLLFKLAWQNYERFKIFFRNVMRTRVYEFINGKVESN